MKTLADNFVVEPQTTDERVIGEVKRKLECRFEKQEREIVGIKRIQHQVDLNPLADALKGLGV